MKDPNVNFYDVQDSFESYWQNHEVEKGKGFKQFKRWEWFMEQRVYPSGDRMDVLATWKETASERRMRLAGAKMGGVWSYYGNTSVPGSGGGAGRINMVRPDPIDPNTFYACAPGGGIWKTSNTGASWELLNTDDLASIGVSDVAIDPNDTQIMYLATGDGDAGDTYALGILKSTDGGFTWNTTGLNWDVTQTRTTSRILIHPSNSNILVAATSNGIYKTTDAGVSWTRTQTGSFKDITFKPGDPNTVYATGSSFYLSTDNGDSFTQITSGLPTSGVSRMAVTASADAPNTVYILAGSSANQGFEGFYRSTDSGANFTQMANSPNLLGWEVNGSDTGGQAWYDLAVAADPNDADAVYVGGVNVWKTTDGGTTWELNAHWFGGGNEPYVHADNHGFSFIPGTSTFLIGGDGGVFMSTDLGDSYTDISSNLEIAQMYRLGVSQTQTDKVITGWQDNGTNLKDGLNWNQVIGGDGFEAIVDYTNEDILYGALYYGLILKSTGGGFSTIVNSNGGGVNSQGAWLTPYVMDPNDHNTLYVGKSTIYKSTDAGANWAALGAIPGGNMDEIAVAKSNSNYIYCSKGANLYLSTDGTNFNALSGYPNAYITYIAVDPADETRVWVTFSGYTNNQKVYYSDDAGATWSNYSDGLPNLPVNCITYMENSSDGLYVGTDAGVYYRDSSFGAWQPYKDGLPNVVVTELEVQYSSNSIIASTYGRGLWKAPLFTLPQIDGAIVSIEQPMGTICETSIAPRVVIGNFGEDDLTSVTFDYGVQGGTTSSYTWTGALATGSTETITLTNFDEGTGSFTFDVQITDVNSLGTDGNALNDASNSSYFVTGGTNDVTLSLTTDCWANETSFDVVDDQGNVVFSGTGYENYTTNDIVMCLPDGCFTLNINDSYGDGLSGSGCTSAGDYTLTDENGVVLASLQTSNFGNQESTQFCVPFVAVSGCMDPTANNYDPNANVDDGSCTYSCANYTLVLDTDCYGGEISWNLTDDQGTILYEAVQGTLASQTNYNEVFCLNDGCYTFAINDSYGDGMNGTAFGCAVDGNYYMTDPQGNVIFQMAVPDYDFGTTHDFCVSTDIDGCTDASACNYDPTATNDDGSCILPNGCTDVTACNYDPAATCDDGSCILPNGCTDATACNYDPAATCDDGSCILPNGCTDATACNYDPAATCDDGSCILPNGCTDATACNYDPAATCDDGSCILPNGCTDTTACNYDPAATCDDGSCILPNGCTDASACNYDPAATCDDGSCILPNGCTDATACNYDPAATCDDGSCILPNGCTDATACNFDPAATCDDGSCEYTSCAGCTDATACNYDPTATIDNGTCEAPSLVFYADTDEDGYGDANVSITACSQPAGYVTNDLDCDDTRNDVYPNAPSTQEGIDNDCSGNIDPDEEAPCLGDFNQDETRDVMDLLHFLGEFGCQGSCASDMTQDGIVDSGDLLMFLGLFGQDCP